MFCMTVSATTSETGTATTSETVQRQTPQTVTWYSYGLSSLCCCNRTCNAKHRGTTLATYTRAIPLWLRYVGDTFIAGTKTKSTIFRQNADIQFTKEIEENEKIPFLACFVTRGNNSDYGKATHTDRLREKSSYNPTSHKASTLRTLTRRAQLVRVAWQLKRRDW